MTIDTFTIKFNEYELETILSALDDYRHYDDEGADPEDLIGGTPVLARVNAIEEKISDAFANESDILSYIELILSMIGDLPMRSSGSMPSSS